MRGENCFLVRKNIKVDLKNMYLSLKIKMNLELCFAHINNFVNSKYDII